MARTYSSLNWDLAGPRVMRWLREYVKSRGVRGAVQAAAQAFAAEGVTIPRLNNYLHGGGGAREWNAIKLLGPDAVIVEPTPDLPPIPPPPAKPEQTVETSEKDGAIEARADGRTIRTVEDLLRHIEADMTRFEIASSEATKYEGLTKNDDGEAVVTEMFRVFVRLKPKAGPTALEAVEAMLTGAFRERSAPQVPALPRRVGDTLQLVVVADPHFGKYAWRGSTGGPDYDLTIARRVVLEAALDLIARGDSGYRIDRRIVAFIGDVFHYDTPAGTTTGGTAMDRDGRYQKMIAVGADTCIGLVEASAAVPTEVIVVPGNHDEFMSAAFQRILIERFRLDKRITVDPSHLRRKYRAWGNNLLGFTHGDEVKKAVLPGLMAHEAAEQWSATQYREFHTGHFHTKKAEWQRPIEEIDGVLVRIAPSLGAADDWHTRRGYIAGRAMETFFYRKSGGLAGTLNYSPDFPTTEAA